MPFREIELLETDSGRCHVADYIRSVKNSNESKVRLMEALNFVAEHEKPPVTLLKKMSGHDNLWEIRSGKHRLLGFMEGAHKMILTNAFQKQSQKTPKDEIELALRRRSQYYQQRK